MKSRREMLGFGSFSMSQILPDDSIRDGKFVTRKNREGISLGTRPYGLDRNNKEQKTKRVDPDESTLSGRYSGRIR